jgi:hypothetical protein
LISLFVNVAFVEPVNASAANGLIPAISEAKERGLPQTEVFLFSISWPITGL